MDIQWLVRRDLPEVLAIEKACYKFPWTEEVFVKRLEGAGTIAMSLRGEDGVVNGFMVYHNGDLGPRGQGDLGPRGQGDLGPRGQGVTLINLAIKPDLQRQGLGSLMLDRLKYKAACGRRKEIRALVHERNLSAHLWLKANDFLGFKVERGVFGLDDGFWFRFKL